MWLRERDVQCIAMSPLLRQCLLSEYNQRNRIINANASQFLQINLFIYIWIYFTIKQEKKIRKWKTTSSLLSVSPGEKQWVVSAEFNLNSPSLEETRHQHQTYPSVFNFATHLHGDIFSEVLDTGVDSNMYNHELLKLV